MRNPWMKDGIDKNNSRSLSSDNGVEIDADQTPTADWYNDLKRKVASLEPYLAAGHIVTFQQTLAEGKKFFLKSLQKPFMSPKQYAPFIFLQAWFSRPCGPQLRGSPPRDPKGISGLPRMPEPWSLCTAADSRQS